MKKVVLIVGCVMGTIGFASASDSFSYTATDAPGNTPDGIDQNSNPVNVWSVVLTPGAPGNNGEGVYYGTPDSEPNAWQEYSYQNTAPGNGGSVDAYNTFAGGALSIGQTVSLNFGMRALDPGTQAGLSLLNGSGNAITFAIIGGGPDNYYYTDAGSTDASAGAGLGYQYQDDFYIAFTVTGAGTYSATAFNGSGADNWTGTFSGSLIGIDVFNHAGGNGSDVAFNNLTVVPEPGTIAFVGIGLALLVGGRYRSSNTVRSRD